MTNASRSQPTAPETPRVRLNRERVLRAAVELADRDGIDSLSMRRLSEHLGVVPMALYKHVAHKDQLLDAMVDLIVSEIEPTPRRASWQAAVGDQILAARRALLSHQWAREVLESRTAPTPAVLGHMNAVIGHLRRGGLSIDLTHHAMHALGSRIWGFTQELFASDPSPSPPPSPEVMAAMAQLFPYVAEIAEVVAHDSQSVVGGGCDDQFEFEFALDLLLNGIARLHKAKWSSGSPSVLAAGAAPARGAHRERTQGRRPSA